VVNNSRIGIQIIPSDPFWVQVRIAIDQQALKLNFDLIPFDINNLELPATAFAGLVEEIVAEELDALIILDLPGPLINLILEQNIPVISLVEHFGFLKQPGNQGNLASPIGNENIARLMTTYLLEKLQGKGSVLVIGGLTLAMDGIEGMGEDGRIMLAAISEAFAPYPSIEVKHIPTSWNYTWAYPQIETALKQLTTPPDVIFGLSDTLALLGLDIAQQLGLLTPEVLVVGIFGDPQALAAIAGGTMAASVGISAVHLATTAVELALQAASGQPVPRYFNYETRLITSKNITEVAVQKLIAIAELPTHLVGVNRRREQQQLSQLETNLVINRQIGALLDHQELIRTVVNLIRKNFNYDRVQLYLWSESDRALLLNEPGSPDDGEVKINLDSGVLSQVLKSNELIFVPDMRNSQRFAPDPRWPELRSRVVLPVRFGDKVLGVLDLQHEQMRNHSREQLLGLQLLADQIAIAIRNAELYRDALTARKVAEKADKLKTLLLANVSHEFRTPLNIILGYSKEALNVPNSYNSELPTELIADLGRIYRSGEHLLRLINDLLDLSRAEINELEVYPEIIDLRPILEEVFHNMANLRTRQSNITWKFEVPPNLPLLQADPVRLRQILLNLLSNALKFTRQGQITLGAEVQPPYIHIWVQDTGAGISIDQQEHIFEPFTVGENSDQHSGGIGLGLTITRHLITLHRGSITVESLPARGSTFNIYLPLPNLSGQLLMLPPSASQSQVNLVYISNRPELPPEIEVLSRQINIKIYQLRPSEVRERLLELQPSILAWDSSTLQETDWLIMDYLRKSAQLSRLPLLLYGGTADSSGSRQTGTTNILLKPFSGQTLQILLETNRPKQSQGGILIVDDDKQSLDLYQQLVESAFPGFVIHRAENGHKALDLLKELVPDLVIIDLVMPEIDGCDVVEWIRANPQTRNVPVIVISGKVLSAESVKRLEFARVVFQSKNILNPDETINILQMALQGTTLLPQSNSMLVKRAVAYIQNKYSQPLSLDEIAREVGISKKRLEKNFHQELGISPWEYLTRYRVKEAKGFLKTTNLNITEVAAKIGFEDPAYFSRIFRSQTGQSPTDYRNS
jgi:signal transduction histidine kinase/AraC-like DNA-binding protein/ABC-type sugar transport system substrate-binding protein